MTSDFCAESKRALAVALRDGLETLLRGTHDGWQVHDRQRPCARDQRRPVLAEDQHADEAVDDGRDAGERLRRVFDGRDELFIRRIFV